MKRRTNWRLIPQSSDRPGLRALLLLAVFVLVAVSFWWHFERRMDALWRADMRDTAPILKSDGAHRFQEWQRSFKTRLGLDVRGRMEPEQKDTCMEPF